MKFLEKNMTKEEILKRAFLINFKGVQNETTDIADNWNFYSLIKANVDILVEWCNVPKYLNKETNRMKSGYNRLHISNKYSANIPQFVGKMKAYCFDGDGDMRFCYAENDYIDVEYISEYDICKELFLKEKIAILGDDSTTGKDFKLAEIEDYSEKCFKISGAFVPKSQCLINEEIVVVPLWLCKKNSIGGF